jgi:hypothetical protein
MADSETRNVVVSQPKGVSFAVSGNNRQDPLSHRLGGEVAHRTDQPLVHMHLWNEACVGKIELRGNPDEPIAVDHRFPDGHRQNHALDTALDAPIHHALQMRTPLQVRFCNTWHVASDYTMGIDFRGQRLIDIRLTGATVATPQPCPESECAPGPSPVVHP